MIYNSGPLGLFAFAITTFFNGARNAGLIESECMPLLMNIGFWYGGLIQVFVGVEEAARSNVFGATAFLSYGFFWVTNSALEYNQEYNPVDGQTEFPNMKMAWLLIWALFTFVMFAFTFEKHGRHNNVLSLTFGLVAVLLVCLAIGEHNEDFHKLGGYLGLLAGTTAFYTGTAELVNTHLEKEIVPVGWTEPLEQKIQKVPFEEHTNSTPLGLISFAVTYVLVGLKNADIVEAESAPFILVIAFWIGGICMLIVGLHKAYCKESFKLCTFSTFATFWLIYASMDYLETHKHIEGQESYEDAKSLWCALFACYTLVVLVCALKTRKNLILMGMFVFAFLMNVTMAIGAHDDDMFKVSGYMSIIAGSFAFVACASSLSLAHFKRQIIPFGYYDDEAEENKEEVNVTKNILNEAVEVESVDSDVAERV